MEVERPADGAVGLGRDATGVTTTGSTDTTATGGAAAAQRADTAVQDGQARADDVQPTEADEEAESTRTGQVAYAGEAKA